MKLIHYLKEGAVAEKPALINFYLHKEKVFDKETSLKKFTEYHLMIKIPNLKYLKSLKNK